MISPMNQNYLLETEIYAKVAQLFKNEDDLLMEFIQFLPEAYSNQNPLAHLQQHQQQLQQQQQAQQQHLLSNVSFCLSVWV